MKTMTCGATWWAVRTLRIKGTTADEVIKAQDRHLNEMVAQR